MTECEASLLGREAIHGSANAVALAALVKTLTRTAELRRRYVLRCSRDHGLQMIPSRRLEDEGFESDEDLTSLGSYEDSSSSIFVSDHVVCVKGATAAAAAADGNRNGGVSGGGICQKTRRSSSQLRSDAEPTAGSVSSIGTDSANSSGASDNDETDNCSSNTLSHNVNHKTSVGGESSSSASSSSSSSSFDKKKYDEVERFAFNEVAFCHTDPSLPKIIVWVVKTRRPSKNTNNEYSYGLEAIVFLCHNEQKFRELYKHFQECSRRQKLEKPVRNRCKEEIVLSTTTTTTTKNTTEATVLRHPTSTKLSTSSLQKVKPEAKSNVLMFNLVQRVDTDGVTHIEVTRPTTETRQHRMLADGEPSSIISINTPDSGDVKAVYLPQKSEKLIESVIRTVEEGESQPPERPERKKSSSKHSNTGVNTSVVESNVHGAVNEHEKVVRGEYVRVSVDPKVVSSPVSRVSSAATAVWPSSVVNASPPYPSRLVWRGSDSTRDKENYREPSPQRRSRRADADRYYQHHQQTHGRQRRSRSSVIVRRADGSPKRYPISYRYADNVVPINNSLPNRFFGLLKELTVGNGGSGAADHGSKFRRRRNSVGDVMDGGDGGGCRGTVMNGSGGGCGRVAGDEGGGERSTRKYEKNHALTKSTPNLKSMIKNKSGKFYKEGYNENEPKKVTFSAYATVQVVD